MSDPFLAEIIMFGGNFAPRGWAFCDGQLLAISSYSALFSLLGTTYGGDGRTTFGLPDLRGRMPMHPGNGPGLTPHTWGQRGGSETVTLLATNLPNHTHTVDLPGDASPGTQPTPGPGLMPAESNEDIYGPGTTPVTMRTVTSSAVGSSTPVSIVQPFLGVYHIIALAGVYPSRS